MAKGGDGGAGQIRADEDARNAQIRKNTADINAMFDGKPASKRGTGAQTTTFAPGQTYYDAAGNPTVPNPGGGSGTVLDQIGVSIPKQPYTGTPLFTGVEDVPGVTGFDDNYFKNVADAYLAYQTPLLQEQAAQARRALPGNFASTSSSAYQRQAANLERDIARETANLSDKSLDFANQQRGSVESNRSDLIGMANSGTDADALATQTAARIAALSKPPAYSPIADLFSKFANQGADYAQAKMYQQLNQYPSRLYYGANPDSVKTVG